MSAYNQPRKILSFTEKRKLFEFMQTVARSEQTGEDKFCVYTPNWDDARVALEAKAIIPEVTLGHVTHMRATEFGRIARNVSRDAATRLAKLEAWATKEFGYNPEA